MRKSRLVIFAIVVITLTLGFWMDFGKVTNNIKLGLDLQGGFEIVYEVSPLEGKTEIPSMAAVVKSVQKRIDVLGVNEPQIMIEGNNRIRVQLAGVKDQEQARKILTSTANMTFRDVNDNLLMGASVIKEGGAALGFQDGVPVVSLKIADQDKFYKVTSDLAAKGAGNNMIVTWLDFVEGVDSYKGEQEKVAAGKQPAYVSAASVSSGINGDAIISGRFTQEEAKQLADLINSGSLPVKMTELYSNVVSAEYGTGAYDVTAYAGVIGVILVMLFMVVMYRLPGILSAFMLMVYCWFVLAVYNLMGGVFTLSGIAGLVMGVGMTVDANILTFERIKEELYTGRSVKRAVEEGNKNSFSSIFDGQLTTFLSALIMYGLGSGSVKGFATMLMVTVFATMVLNVYLVRFLLNLVVKSGFLDQRKSWFGVNAKYIPDVSKGEERTYFGKFSNLDFIKNCKYFVYASLIILGLGLGSALFNGFTGKGFMNMGIDFSSGTKITLQADDTLHSQEVADKFEEFGYKVDRVQLSGNNDEFANVTISEAIAPEDMKVLKEKIEGFYGHEASDSVVSPVVGRELVRNAIMLSALAWVAMLAYIAFRFQFDYALCCVVALLHDVFVVLAFFSFLRFDVNADLIAVLLSIIGYSVDDSIVIFDRIREFVGKLGDVQHITPKQYREAVNSSLQQTFLRSIFNSFTTLLPLLALLFMGSSSIFNFNFAMLIGLVAGSYSSIFIAAQLWYWIRINKKNWNQKPKKEKKEKKNKEISEWTIPGINN